MDKAISYHLYVDLNITRSGYSCFSAIELLETMKLHPGFWVFMATLFDHTYYCFVLCLLHMIDLIITC
jgi:hypothetical protein